jgi:predicted metal-dependent HD superfamily phosphohydrolase
MTSLTSSLTRGAFRDLVQSHKSKDDDNDEDDVIIDQAYEAILRAYDGDDGERQRHRHYHTMTHIHSMWAAWDHYTKVVQCISSPHSDKVVRLAILFHEYDRPGSD